MERITIELPAGKFHALESDRGGRPLLFLHGFPDHPPTAVSFLTELESRGHRVLAPWLRGYAPSPTPAHFAFSESRRRCHHADRSLVAGSPRRSRRSRLGRGPTYAVCARAPQKVVRAVTLAIPHPLTFIRRLRTPAQLRASWYMALFQLPGAERIAAAQDFRLIDRLWRRWSPDFQLSAGAARRAA